MFSSTDGAEDRVIRDAGPLDAWGWEEFAEYHPAPDSGARAGGAVETIADVEERSFAAGYAEGMAEGRALAEAEYVSILTALKATIAKFEELSEARGTAAEERVRALALAVGRVLVDRELRTEPSDVIQLVRKSLALFPSEAALEVRLHPEDLSALVRPQEGEVAPPSMGRGGALKWTADPELDRGDVVVEGPERILDGRILPCLERIWEELSDA